MQKSLLESLIPSIPQVHEIIETIRERHNIDIVLRGNQEMIKTVEAQKTQEEWDEVLSDIEKELRDKFNPFELEDNPFLAALVTMVVNSKAIPGLENMNVEVHDPAFAQMIASVLAGTPSVNKFMDQFYGTGAKELLRYIMKAEPIELPNILFTLVGFFTFPPGKDGENFVIAVATQLTDPEEIINEFRAKMVDAFGEKPNIKDEYLEDAELLVKKNLGESVEEVVDYYLEYHPDAIRFRIGTSEYEDAKEVLINSMKVRLWRLQKLINKIVGYKN